MLVYENTAQQDRFQYLIRRIAYIIFTMFHNHMSNLLTEEK